MLGDPLSSTPQPTGVEAKIGWEETSDDQFPSDGVETVAPIQELNLLYGETAFQAVGEAASLPPSPSLEEATVLRTGCQASCPSHGRRGGRKGGAPTIWKYPIQKK